MMMIKTVIAKELADCTYNITSVRKTRINTKTK